MFSKDIFSRHKRTSSKSRALPHLTTKGVSIPDVQVSATDSELLMPGQKPLPDADWRSENENEQQLVPTNQSNTVTRRLSVQKQGLPWSGRGNYDEHAEPPPMFSAKPSRNTSIRHVRESNAQKQVYRMDGGVDPVSLLSSRLEAWRLAIKAMVSLFKKFIIVEERTSKGLIEASKDISVPFEKSNGQFLEVGTGGIQDVWGALRDYTVEHGIMFHESAGYIEKSVVPSLRAVKTDIKNMLLAIQKDRNLKSDAIFESRLKVDKLIGRLDKSIEQCNRNPQQADQNTDPFLINLHIIHAIRELCDNENRLHDNILSLQKEVGLFEEKIIENCRYVLQKFQEFRLTKKMEHKDIIDKVIQTFNSIKPSLEWNEFVRRHQYNLILENSAYKTEDMVEYPNQHSAFTRAIKVGPLDSKSGPLKGFSQSVYILTPAGFLHGYKSAKYFQTSPLQPSYTIFVPNCDIEYDESDGSFQIRGTNKRSSIGLGTTHSFRPATQQDGQEWMAELRKMSEQFKVVPILETSVYSSVPSQSDKPALPASIMPLPPPQAIEQPHPQAIEEDTQLKGESDLDPVLDGEQPLLDENDELDPPDDHPNASTHLPHPAAAIITGSDKIAADEHPQQDNATVRTLPGSHSQSIYSTSIANADSADHIVSAPSNSSSILTPATPTSPTTPITPMNNAPTAAVQETNALNNAAGVNNAQPAPAVAVQQNNAMNYTNSPNTSMNNLSGQAPQTAAVNQTTAMNDSTGANNIRSPPADSMNYVASPIGSMHNLTGQTPPTAAVNQTAALNNTTGVNNVQSPSTDSMNNLTDQTPTTAAVQETAAMNQATGVNNIQTAPTAAVEQTAAANTADNYQTQHRHNESVDTITQPIYTSHLSNLSQDSQRPTRGIKHTGSTTSIDAINNYVGLGATQGMEKVNSTKEESDIIPPSQQLQNQDNFNQNIYDQTLPSNSKTTNPFEEGYDDDNSSVDYYSVTNEEFDKTIDSSDEEENMEHVKRQLEGNEYQPALNEAHQNTTTTSPTAL